MPGRGTSAPHWRKPGPQTTGESSGHLVRIGAALSLSGPAAAIGAAQRNGLRLAQDEINAARLLGSARLEVVIEDDGSRRDQAADVFQKFIANSHVSAIVGPTLSDTALAVDPIAQEAGIPVLAISNTAGSLTEIGNFIFRDCLSESQLTPQVIDHLRSRLNLRTAAMLYSNTDPNRSGSHGYKQALQELGVRIATEQVFSADQTDFTPELAEIASVQPDAVFIAAPSYLAAAILIQARQTGLANVPIVGTNAFNSAGVIKAAGDAAEGLIVGSGWSAANPSPRNQQFIQSYRNRYGSDPDQPAAQAYTGVYILAQALQATHLLGDPRALRDALEQMTTPTLETPLGSFAFNDAHDAVYAPSVQIVRNGQFQLF